MFLEVIGISIVIGLIRGGSLSNLKNLDFKFVYTIFTAYLIQLGIDYWGTRHPWGGYPYFHIASYFLLFFALYMNRAVSGIKLIFGGTVLNFLVIAVNGGVMPVRNDILPEHISAAYAAGLGGTHGLLAEHTRLKFLADILYLPIPYQPQVLSFGDLVMNAGILAVLIKAMGTREHA